MAAGKFAAVLGAAGTTAPVGTGRFATVLVATGTCTFATVVVATGSFAAVLLDTDKFEIIFATVGELDTIFFTTDKFVADSVAAVGYCTAILAAVDAALGAAGVGADGIRKAFVTTGEVSKVRLTKVICDSI